MHFKVLSPNNKLLFQGEKRECIEYIKDNGLNRDEFKLRSAGQEYETTSFHKPKGFFKRIFRSD